MGHNQILFVMTTLKEIMGHRIFFFSLRIKDLVYIIVSHTYSLTITSTCIADFQWLQNSSALMASHYLIMVCLVKLLMMKLPQLICCCLPLMLDLKVMLYKLLPRSDVLLYNLQPHHKILNTLH